MSNKVKNVVDAEIVQEGTVEIPQCEIILGVGEAGNVYYKIHGSNQSLVLIEGLLKYAQIENERLWAASVEQNKKAQEE